MPTFAPLIRVSCRPRAVTINRARATGLPSEKPFRRYGAPRTTDTWLPHGPAPYPAIARAAGHPPSLKPGFCHPAGPLWLAFQAASVTSRVLPPPVTSSAAIRPAGETVVFSVAIAIV